MDLEIDSYYMASCGRFGCNQRNLCIISTIGGISILQIYLLTLLAGVAQLVELQPSKLDVASSNLVSRSSSF